MENKRFRYINLPIDKWRKKDRERIAETCLERDGVGCGGVRGRRGEGGG